MILLLECLVCFQFFCRTMISLLASCFALLDLYLHIAKTDEDVNCVTGGKAKTLRTRLQDPFFKATNVQAEFDKPFAKYLPKRSTSYVKSRQMYVYFWSTLRFVIYLWQLCLWALTQSICLKALLRQFASFKRICVSESWRIRTKYLMSENLSSIKT